MVNEATNRGEICLPTTHNTLAILPVVSLMILLLTACTGNENERAIAEISIEPERVELTVGERTQLEAVGILADGEEIEVSPEWSHSGNLGHFSEKGEFRAERVGEGRILASVDGVEAVANVIVTAASASELRLESESDEVPAGGGTTLTVTAVDEDGDPVPEVDVTVSAETDAVTLEPAEGQTSSEGTFTTKLSFAGRKGKLVVTAATEGVSHSLTLEGVAGTPAQLSVEADPARILTGDSTTIRARITDQFDNPIPQTEVRFSLATGEASLAESSAMTDAEGRASVRVTAADRVGDIVVEVAAGELEPKRAEVHGGRLSRLVVRPEKAELRSGSSRSFDVRGFDEAGTVVPVEPTWGVRGEVGKIDDDGTFTGVRAGEGSVVATLRTVTATAEVVVKPGDLASIAISPRRASVTAGESIRLQAEGFDAAGNAIEIEPKWSFVDQSDERSGALDASGVFRAEAARDFEIQATVNDVDATANLKVTPAALADIHVSPEKALAKAGSERVFEVTGYDVYGNEIEVSPRWVVDGDIGTVDASGRFRATRAGSGELVAMSGHRAGSAEIEVVPAELAEIRVEPETSELVSGTTTQFSATGQDDFGNRIEVSPTWSVRGEIGTIDDDGRFTAVFAGNGAVVARSEAVAGEQPVHVVPGPLTSIEISPSRVELAAGTTETFRSVGLDAAGNEIELSPEWAVTDDIGVIAANGSFEARIAGEGNVVARRGELTSRASVIVKPGKLVEIEVEPARLEAEAGETTSFSGTGRDVYGNAIAIEPAWTITGRIGEIDAETGRFEAQTVGSGTVVATVGGVGGKADVTVDAGPLARIEIGPTQGPIEMTAGESHRFSASGFDASGNAVPIEPEWSIEGAFGRIDETGELMVTKAGRGEVVAAANDVTARMIVDVRPGALAWLELSPSEVALTSAETTTFELIAEDHFGNEVDVSPEWSVTNDIGQVSRGTFSAAVAGTGRVVARAESLDASADIVVTPGPTVSIRVRPESTTVPAGSTVTFEAEGRDAHGNATKVDPSWSVTSEVGAVDDRGRFTAASAGSGKVLAAISDVVGSANVTTVPGEIVELAIEADSEEVRSGKTLSLDAVGFDAYGNRIESPEVTWRVEGDFGTINSDTGLFTAVRAMSGTVVAEHESVRGTMRLKVVPGEPSPATSMVRVNPESVAASAEARISVHVEVRDRFRNPIPEARVELSTNRPEHDTLHPDQKQTDANGVAKFRVSSSAPGTSTLEVLAEGVTLTRNTVLRFHDDTD